MYCSLHDFTAHLSQTDGNLSRTLSSKIQSLTGTNRKAGEKSYQRYQEDIFQNKPNDLEGYRLKPIAKQIIYQANIERPQGCLKYTSFVVLLIIHRMLLFKTFYSFH